MEGKEWLNIRKVIFYKLWFEIIANLRIIPLTTKELLRISHFSIL